MGWRRVRRGVEWGSEKFFGTVSENYEQLACGGGSSFLLKFSVSIDALDASTPVHAAQGLRGGDEATSRQVATSSSKKKGFPPHSPTRLGDI